mmetsp:Transcript_31044/g.78426  ORF Transcript_31044/g.78426 Transcript_31044/m.78426 type:complete len:258 (+) Transcript_31044:505-1278(+)
MSDARLGRDPDLGHDRHVILYRRLAAHNHPVAQLCRAADGAVRAEQAAAPDDGVVPDLHHVVQLGVLPDVRVSPAAAVDARVGADLHSVHDAHPQRLRLFKHLPVPVDDEAKPVLADAHARMQDHAVPNGAVLQRGVVAHAAAGAQLHARPQHRAGLRDRALRHPRSRVHHRARLDAHAGVQLRAAVHQAAAVRPHHKLAAAGQRRRSVAARSRRARIPCRPSLMPVAPAPESGAALLGRKTRCHVPQRRSQQRCLA